MHANALELWIPTELKELNSLYINSSRQIHPSSVKFNAVHRYRQTTEELRQVASQILHKADGLHKINNDYFDACVDATSIGGVVELLERITLESAKVGRYR